MRKPTFLSIDVGYSFSPSFALLLRAASWLSYDPYGVQLLGAGVNVTFSPDGMYVAGVVGLSVLDPSFGLPGKSNEKLQGLGLQLELGQRWPLSAAFDFGIGAHFEVGTPWLGDPIDATALGAGLFASIGY